MDRHRHHAQLWCHQQHDRSEVRSGQSRQVLRVARIFEAGLVERFLLNRVGHNGRSDAGPHQIHGTLNGTGHRVAVGWVELCRPILGREAVSEDRKGIGERTARLAGVVNGGNLHATPDTARTCCHGVWIIKQQERRQRAGGCFASEPGHYGQLPADPSRLARCEDERGAFHRIRPGHRQRRFAASPEDIVAPGSRTVGSPIAGESARLRLGCCRSLRVRRASAP